MEQETKEGGGVKIIEETISVDQRLLRQIDGLGSEPEIALTMGLEFLRVGMDLGDVVKAAAEVARGAGTVLPASEESSYGSYRGPFYRQWKNGMDATMWQSVTRDEALFVDLDGIEHWLAPGTTRVAFGGYRPVLLPTKKAAEIRGNRRWHDKCEDDWRPAE